METETPMDYGRVMTPIHVELSPGGIKKLGNKTNKKPVGLTLFNNAILETNLPKLGKKIKRPVLRPMRDTF